MFKKTERLGRAAFTNYFKIGRRFQSEYFTLVFTPAPLRAVAVVVGKKVHKQAVDRNTLRRRVYAAARTEMEATVTTNGIYIIIAKPTAKNLTQTAIAPAVASLLATTQKPR